MRHNTITHVILTGGVGSRLWPLTRKSQSKQYFEIFNGKSLLEMIVERNRNIANKIMVVCNVNNCHLSRMILEKSATEYIDIIEATPRNTAAALAFAAFASLFLSVAKVEILIPSITYGAEFIYDNLMVQNNVIHKKKISFENLYS